MVKWGRKEWEEVEMGDTVELLGVGKAPCRASYEHVFEGLESWSYLCRVVMYEKRVFQSWNQIHSRKYNKN